MGSVAVTGMGLEFPGLPDASALLEAAAPVEPGEFKPEAKLGRKGLLFKDRATRLALCAAHSALQDAGLPVAASTQLAPEELGVVVSSNLGNLDTVCRVVETIHAGSVNDTSALDLPNASSNVVATSIAIRFGCRALNLMLCSGAGSGVDAVYVAANAIRAGRARRMIVVGVEPASVAAARLMRESFQAWLGNGEAPRLGEGAGALVLEDEAAARERGQPILGRVARYHSAAGLNLAPSVQWLLSGEPVPDVWLTPHCDYPPTAAAVSSTLSGWKPAPAIVDLGRPLGDTYGALGVLQAITACLWLREHDGQLALMTSGAAWNDGSSSLLIRRGES